MAANQPSAVLKSFFELILNHIPEHLSTLLSLSGISLARLISNRKDPQICDYFFNLVWQEDRTLLISFLGDPTTLQNLTPDCRGKMIYQIIENNYSRLTPEYISKLQPYKRDVLNHIYRLPPTHQKLSLERSLESDTSLGSYFNLPTGTRYCGLFPKSNAMKDEISERLRILRHEEPAEKGAVSNTLST
jgi:hypothetical protein